jgi:hypothetical protein
LFRRTLFVFSAFPAFNPSQAKPPKGRPAPYPSRTFVLSLFRRTFSVLSAFPAFTPAKLSHQKAAPFRYPSRTLAFSVTPFISIHLNFNRRNADSNIGVLPLTAKKTVSLLFILAVLGAAREGNAPSAYAQDVVGLSLSLGLEGNGYSLTSMGFGFKLSGDYRFGESLSIGTTSLFASDESLTTLEFSANIRWYFLRDEESLIKYYNWASVFHLFAQVDGGATVVIRDADQVKPHPMIGLVAGSRIALSRFGSFYVEPYLRVGYPFLFALGVSGVYRFPITGVFW